MTEKYELPREVRVPTPEPERQLPPTIPTAFAKKGNGPAPKDARGMVQSGLVEFDILLAQCNQLENDLMAARERIHLLELQIKEIEGTRATIESRINTCILERDQAVREAGELKGVLNVISTACVRYVSYHQEPETGTVHE